MAKLWALLTPLLAILVPYLYDRYYVLSNMFSNRPANFKEIYNIKGHEIKFQEVLKNCEDFLLEESLGVVFLGCTPGRDRWNVVMGTFEAPQARNPDEDVGSLWVYDYSRPNPDDRSLRKLTLVGFNKKPLDFQPLGIEFDAESSTIFVINHSRTLGTVIELFRIDIEAETATHLLTYSHPLLHSPNSIHALGNGKLLVTNDHWLRASVSPLLSTVETFSGIPGGSVVYTDIHNPDTSKLLAYLPFANGITMLNSTTLAVASSAKPALYFYTVGQDYRSLDLQTFVRMPVSVDNLSRDSNGALLVAGHPFATELVALSKRRADCDEQGTKTQREACRCSAPSWVGEWTEEGGLKELMKVGSGVYCSSCTAARDVKRGVGFVSGLYARGLLEFRE